MEKRLKINEIFQSIQGEGHFTGTPVIFIRFAGCNMACEWCDTDFSEQIVMGLRELIANAVVYSPINRVVFTGGEPCLQVDADMARLFQKAGFKIHLETNGSIPFQRNIFDWVTVSPKNLATWQLRHGSELKLVYNGQSWDEIDHYRTESDFMFYYLQPESSWLGSPPKPDRVQELLNIILKGAGKWKLSLQTQKWLSIR